MTRLGVLALAAAASCAGACSAKAPPAVPEAKVTTAPATKTAPPTTLTTSSPSISADGPIGVLVKELLALPDGPLPGPEGLTLPPGSGLFRHGRGKRHVIKIIDGSTVAHLRFSMKDGTWEGPAGNSAPDPTAPVIETIELEAVGSVAVAAPSATSVVVTEAWRLPSNDSLPPTSVHHWGEGAYFKQGSATEPFWLTRSAGRAPFHVVEAERAAFDDVLVDITKALAAGETDLVALMATRFASHSVPVPPPKEPDRLSIYERGPPRPLAVYAFDAGRVEVMAPQYLNAILHVPMRLPKLFETHGMTRIVTHFAHDYGQMAEALKGQGFSISPGRYRIRQENAHSAEDGDPREARFSALSISVAPGQKAEH